MSVLSHKVRYGTQKDLAVEVSFLKKVTKSNYLIFIPEKTFHASFYQLNIHAFQASMDQNCFQLNATPSRAVPRCPGSAASLWSAAKFQRAKGNKRMAVWHEFNPQEFTFPAYL